MKHLMILHIVIIVAAFNTVVADDSSKYMDLVAQADSMIESANWSSAETIINKAISLEPNNPGNILLMSNLGIVLFNQGKDSLALATLNEAHRIAPASVTVLNNRGRINAAIGNNLEALNDFGEIMKLDSTLWEPVFYHGMIAMNMGDVETAKKDFMLLEVMAPNENETHLAMASFHMATDNKREAIKELTWLIDKEKDADLLLERAVLYLKLDELNEASMDIAEVIATAPNLPEAYLYRAMLNKLRFRIDDAKADAKYAIDLGLDPMIVKQILNF